MPKMTIHIPPCKPSPLLVGIAFAYSLCRHAAASYAHLELLDYLISKGGDINHADSDGETPLFTVESVDVAKWMIERGAKYDVKNAEGESVRLVMRRLVLRR
jgi:hypothetical protein